LFLALGMNAQNITVKGTVKDSAGEPNYPNSFKNASPEEYKHALELMGMTDENTVTPLWWAKK